MANGSGMVVPINLAKKNFDPSTPSMRKEDDGKKKIMLFLVATNLIDSQLP